ncbi:MAG: cofactor-independent phosphoglycerate mutase [Candidatus Nezhaarchaeales archaeon]
MRVKPKFIFIVGDGMADRPVDELGGKTPLEVAVHPNMDEVASRGEVGLIKAIPEGMEPGSEVANLSIMGYDPKKYFTGRGPLEAAGQGIPLSDEDLVFRCNLITEKDGVLVDYAAGHIGSEDARILIEALNREIKDPNIKLYAGVSYRNLLILKGSKYSASVTCTPPHHAEGRRINDILVKPIDVNGVATANLLNSLILNSKKVLDQHPVNLRREGSGKANMIWPWGVGRRPKLPRFKDKWSLTAGVISAVNLIKGIAACAGMDIVNVPGATGYYDTNYQGKAMYALKYLEKHDFIYIHVEAPDEAGHAGDYEMKIRTIEHVDKKVVGCILDNVSRFEEYVIAIMADHATPVKLKIHVSDPVPFAFHYSKINVRSHRAFNEGAIGRSKHLLIDPGHLLMAYLVNRVRS